MSRNYNIYARLLLGGVGVPISNFTLESPPDTLGAVLSCDLANPIATPDASLAATFDVGIQTTGSIEWVTLMDIGEVFDVTYRTRFVSAGGDIVALKARSALAKRWDISPPTPIVLYDPAQITVPTDTVSSLGDIVDEDHAFIEPEYVPIASLDLTALLRYVYIDQLGFTDVVTNLVNFSIQTVSIGLSDTFHSVVQREVGIFEPVYYADDFGTLWIIDPQGVLPTGLETRQFGANRYAELQRSKQTGRLINSVLLNYRDTSVASSVPTLRSEQETQEVGTIGDDDFQRTVITRYLADYNDNPSSPTEVTRSVLTRIVTETSGRRDGHTRLLSSEDTQYTYSNDFRLDTGYTKQIGIYAAFPGESAKFRPNVLTEVTESTWRELTSRPGEYQKRFEIRQVSGTVIKTQDDPADDTTIVRVALYDANRTDPNNIPEDAEVETARPIRSQIDSLRVAGNDQIEISRHRINHLTNAPSIDEVIPHTGTIQVNVSPQISTASMLIVADGTVDSDRRPPAQLNAGNVPFTQAKTLANRILARRGANPVTANVTLAGVDLAMRKGSIRVLLDRLATQYRTFITGWKIDGQNLGQPNFTVTHNCSGLVIG